MEISTRDLPGAGAAGGMGAGMAAFFGSRLQPGIETVLDTVRFEEVIRDADWIFTGEGRLDGQSLRDVYKRQLPGSVPPGLFLPCGRAVPPPSGGFCPQTGKNPERFRRRGGKTAKRSALFFDTFVILDKNAGAAYNKTVTTQRKRESNMERSAGILLPIFSLPSAYGIGSLGREAREFANFLHRCV